MNNKKLTKTRSSRMNTLEAMACNCYCSCDCRICSGGGSLTESENKGRKSINTTNLHKDIRG
jgi:putative bacteriocin precursor